MFIGCQHVSASFYAQLRAKVSHSWSDSPEQKWRALQLVAEPWTVGGDRLGCQIFVGCQKHLSKDGDDQNRKKTWWSLYRDDRGRAWVGTGYCTHQSDMDNKLIVTWWRMCANLWAPILLYCGPICRINMNQPHCLYFLAPSLQGWKVSLIWRF